MEPTPRPEGQTPVSQGPSPIPAAAVPDEFTGICNALVCLFALVLFGSFFMPWVTILGMPLSGLNIRQYFTSFALVWLVPALAVLVLVLTPLGLNTTVFRRLTGLCPFGFLIYGMVRLGFDLPKIINYGGWLALAAGLALVLIPDARKGMAPR